jgi:hypothetical protein
MDISRGTGYSIDEFLKKYCTVTVNDGRNGIFIIGADGVCPFLKGELCSIHAIKPYVCSIFPDPDGYITAKRLKDDAKDSFLNNIGLSRCFIWDIPDDIELKGDIEKTIDFRIREETDAQYFSGTSCVDSRTVIALYGLAMNRLKDERLRWAVKEKYRMIRDFHMGRQVNRGLMIANEAAILKEYCATYSRYFKVSINELKHNGIRATYVKGKPGIAVLIKDNVPEDVLSGFYISKIYGNTGIFSILLISKAMHHNITFTIETPCIEEILTNRKILSLQVKKEQGIIITLECMPFLPVYAVLNMI